MLFTSVCQFYGLLTLFFLFLVIFAIGKTRIQNKLCVYVMCIKFELLNSIFEVRKCEAPKKIYVWLLVRVKFIKDLLFLSASAYVLSDSRDLSMACRGRNNSTSKQLAKFSKEMIELSHSKKPEFSFVFLELLLFVRLLPECFKPSTFYVAFKLYTTKLFFLN